MSDYFISNSTMIVSFILFGNIIDNTVDHKIFITVSNFTIGFIYIVYGLIDLFITKNDFEFSKTTVGFVVV
jgi:hypothetical protein